MTENLLLEFFTHPLIANSLIINASIMINVVEHYNGITNNDAIVPYLFAELLKRAKFKPMESDEKLSITINQFNEDSDLRRAFAFS